MIVSFICDFNLRLLCGFAWRYIISFGVWIHYTFFSNVFAELNYLECTLDFSAEQEKSAENIKYDVNVKENVKSVSDISDGERLVDKETTDAKHFVDEKSKNPDGHLKNEKRHSESGGRRKNKELSAEAEETPSVSSNFGKENANEVLGGNNVTSSACCDPGNDNTENKENTDDGVNKR